MSKEVTGGDTVLAGQFPINTDLIGNGVVGDENSFTCNYGFQQKFWSDGPLTGSTDVFYEGATPTLPPYFIVEGSSENGVVGSVGTNVSVSSGFDWEGAAQSTVNPGYNEFYIHFPTGGGSGGNGFGGNDNPRNPLDVCQIYHGCP